MQKLPMHMGPSKAATTGVFNILTEFLTDFIFLKIGKFVPNARGYSNLGSTELTVYLLVYISDGLSFFM